MKKIAILVVALVALSLGCKVPGLIYCHWDTGDFIAYGGPESKIREMLNDPCDGEKIDAFAFTYRQSKRALDGGRFDVYCGGVKYWITEDSLQLLIWNEQVAIEYGNKAKAAYRRAVKAAKFITENSGKIGWNP